MKLLNRLLNRLDYILVYISAITIFIMMIWIFLDVLLRYFFNSPIPGTLELTGEYFLIIIVYFAISYTHMHKGHVNVEIFYEKFPNIIKKISRLITTFIGLIIFIILGINNYSEGMFKFENNIRSVGLLDYPIGPAFLFISIGILVLSIRFLLEFISVFSNNEGHDFKELR